MTIQWNALKLETNFSVYGNIPGSIKCNHASKCSTLTAYRITALTTPVEHKKLNSTNYDVPGSIRCIHTSKCSIFTAYRITVQGHTEGGFWKPFGFYIPIETLRN